jgi:hypothetical protein
MEPNIGTSHFLTITGVLFPDNRLLLRPGYLTERSEYPVEDSETFLIAELVDDNNQIVLRIPISATPFCGDGPMVEELAVAGIVPFLADLRLIRFYHKEVLIYELNISKAKPEIEINWLPQQVMEGKQTVSWEEFHAEQQKLYFTVSYSYNDGQSWLPLSFNIEEPVQVIDFDQLPGGDLCRIRIIATDGVNTVSSESKSFIVPVKPCYTMILAPENGSSFVFGSSILFRGQGYYLEEQLPEIENLEWISSQNGFLGKGMTIEVKNLPSGKHIITLKTGIGDRAGEAKISVYVKESGQENPEDKKVL